MIATAGTIIVVDIHQHGQPNRDSSAKNVRQIHSVMISKERFDCIRCRSLTQPLLQIVPFRILFLNQIYLQMSAPLFHRFLTLCCSLSIFGCLIPNQTLHSIFLGKSLIHITFLCCQSRRGKLSLTGCATFYSFYLT